MRSRFFSKSERNLVSKRKPRSFFSILAETAPLLKQSDHVERHTQQNPCRRAIHKHRACNDKHFCPDAHDEALAFIVHRGGNDGVCKARHGEKGPRARHTGDTVKDAEEGKECREEDQADCDRNTCRFFRKPQIHVKRKERFAEKANAAPDQKGKQKIFQNGGAPRSFVRVRRIFLLVKPLHCPFPSLLLFFYVFFPLF